VIVFTMFAMGHLKDIPTPLEDSNLENLFKFTCLVFALRMQSLEVGIVFFCAARWFLPCNWDFISQIYMLWF